MWGDGVCLWYGVFVVWELGGMDLQVLSGVTTTAEPQLLILELDGGLDGFEKIALLLQNLSDRFDPFAGQFGI